MRKNIVAGNWKMNLTREEALTLHKEVSDKSQHVKCEIYHFSPFIYLSDLCDSEETNVKIGAQNGYPVTNGAFTGEISMKQLAHLGVDAVLIGHSERRQLFEESNAFLKQKVDAALAENLQVFFCCGETLVERKSEKHEQVVLQQLKDSVFHLTPSQFKNVVIAYEPVWAIGTGHTASAEQADEMHGSIRRAIEENYDSELSGDTSILYGGSCKPDNAEELFQKEHIDGGLIGGASLKSQDFTQIINACK